MPFKRLTDPDAVLRAIAEFDALGRESFLSRYGFGAAQRYFLLYRGMRYDSKAIVGAAFGFQFPEEGPLSPGDFSGGENTVAKQLRSLGFEVSTTGYTPRPPQYWTFRSRPDRYRIREAVQHLDVDDWVIERSDVRKGDYVALWQTQDSEGHRGVVGLGRVVADPTVRPDQGNPYWVDSSDGEDVQARVQIEYLPTPNLPLWVEEQGEGAFLSEWGAATSHGGTVFTLGQDAWYGVALLSGWEGAVSMAVPSGAAMEQILSELTYDRDDRQKPDGHRWVRFRTGWNGAIEGTTYTEETLRAITWDNLGYRMGQQFGAASLPVIGGVYEYLADRYRQSGPMPLKLTLRQGDTLNNEQLRAIFGCSSQGGMRRSKRTSSLVIVSDHVKSIYEDYWDGDVLHYTGMGLEGDQALDYAQNKTLAESDHNGVAVYLFEVFEEGQYYFQGRVRLAGAPYAATQPDANGLMRTVWMFPLRLAEAGWEPVVDEQLLERKTTTREKKLRSLSPQELLKRANQAPAIPRTRKTRGQQFERNQNIARLAKLRAEGVCQLCEEPAPFANKQGEPYLEVHHIEWLARGGTDTLDNTIALCPNCHRRMHVVDKKVDRMKLAKKAEVPYEEGVDE